ncbi:MAG: glycosyltransferase family 1 protein [Myxococcota bacterium]|nr:glycosyltransferase family 1 protein [Myxococcota bacterium]
MAAAKVLVNAISLWEGGSSRNYYSNFLREIDRDSRGFEFTILAPVGQVSPQELGRHRLLEVRLPKFARGAIRILYEELLLPVRARSFDLLYCPADLLPGWGATPCVVAQRNLNIYDRSFYDTPRTRLLYNLIRLALPRATGIVTPSHAAARVIAAQMGIPTDRLHVVPHGIDQVAFDEVPQPIAHERPFLFYPAALERHKNFEVLFEALQLLEDPAFEAWIAGSERLDPEYAASLRRRVRDMGIGNRVRFLGQVPYREILRYYRAATALVFPSALESFGHPLLEAMLSGTPIVASDLETFHEVADEVALFFPTADPRALAAAVTRVTAEPEKTRARVERGHRRAADFTWSHSIDALCAVFEKALEGS